MSEPEQDEREEMFPFPEVFIKMEPQEAQLQAEDEDGMEDLEEGYGGLDVNNFDGLADEDFDGLEDDEQENRGEDGELISQTAPNEMLAEDEDDMEEDLEESYGGLDVNNFDGLADEDFDGLEDDEQENRGEDGEFSSQTAPSEMMQDGMRCALCDKEYSSAASLKAHLSKKHKLAAGPCFTCHLCGAIGQTKATLKRHLLRSHGQGSLMEHQMLRKCQHCEEGFLTLVALNMHIAEAHAELLSQYYQCPYCPALFRARPSLMRHASRRHPDADPPCLEQEQCQDCQMTFPTRTALKMHIKNHHPEALLHKCETCSATFKKPSLLRLHIKKTHENPDDNQRYKGQRYKCSKCPREYRSKNYLERHTLTHLTPKKPRMYTCSICSIKFATRSLRSRHVRTVHWDKHRQKCSECSKEFETLDELNEHRHTHIMNCSVCDKTFLRRDTLREHLLIHNGPKLPCPYCPKTFVQRSNLKRHIRTHTGEKPYKCSLCPKRFADKSACNSHMRVHTGAERCSCPVCGASFSKRQKLNYHMKKHTGEGLLHCPLCSRSATDSYTLKKHLESHQTVLTRLLQSAGVLEQVEDCKRLALRTLHNLAWVTSRSKAIPQKIIPGTSSPVAENAFEEFAEMEQAPTTECKEDGKAACVDSEEGRTDIEHIEVNVKVEIPDELDEEVHSPSSDGGSNSSLRQLRKNSKDDDAPTDPLEDNDSHHNEGEEHYHNVKAEVLRYIMSLRCAQFNEVVKCALEKCELEATNNESSAMLQSQSEHNSEIKSEEIEIKEVEDMSSCETLEDVKPDLSKVAGSDKEDIDLKMIEAEMRNVASEEGQMYGSPMTEEHLMMFARLWRLIIGQAEEQQKCEEVSPFSKCWLKEENSQDKGESDKDTDSSVDLMMQPECELQDSDTCTQEDSKQVIIKSEVLSESEEDSPS